MSSQFADDPPAGFNWFFAMADFVLSAVLLVAWAGLTGKGELAASWSGPVVLLAIGALGRQWVKRRWNGRLSALALSMVIIGAAALLPSWPGADSLGIRSWIVMWALLATWAWRAVARLAAGPHSDGRELARVFLLIAGLLGTWWAYLAPQIVGVVDERWYGDLMTDFLGQVRDGIFPVLVGQGEFAWNGNVHPFRSAPMHHYLGAVVDLCAARRLSPLAVQHVVGLICVFSAVLTLYIGLRRLRSEKPWLAVLVAALFAMCPGITMAQIYHDMYMTSAALPFVVCIALSLWRVLEANSWRAWIGLGAASGAVWFCHPPVAFLALCAVGLTVLLRFTAGPLASGTGWRVAMAGGVFVAISIGYFVSMLELAPLRHGYRPNLENVMVPGLALLGSVAGAAWLHRVRHPVGIGLATGGVLVALAALHTFKPNLWTFMVTVLAAWALLWWVGRCFSPAGTGRWPEFLLGACVLVTGMALGPQLAGDGTIDTWVEGARSGYRTLWRPLRAGGGDQLGYAMAVGLVLAGVAVFRQPQSPLRFLFATVVALCLALAPLPGFARFLWQNTPWAVIDIIGVGYPLRFLPATAPFAAVLIFLTVADGPSIRWNRWAGGALLLLLPWSVWEHLAVVQKSWELRHSAGQTLKHLRPENRPISKFHYDLHLLPRYHNHGGTDYHLETRLWLKRPGRDNLVGPTQYADGIAAVRTTVWHDVAVTQDSAYPAWLYLAPKIILEPGERRVLTFDWRHPDLNGWLICRSENIHREYLLPEFGGSRSFGMGNRTHQTLSLWNSGSKPEAVELVIKREGADATEPWPRGTPIARLREVEYDRYAAPVEIIRLQPLQMRITAEADASVETFRIWLPGYRVSLDGRPISYQQSHNGLLEFQVPAGSHVADVRFRGTPVLRLAVYWSLGAGMILVVMLIIEGLRLARRPVKDFLRQELSSLCPQATDLNPLIR